MAHLNSPFTMGVDTSMEIDDDNDLHPDYMIIYDSVHESRFSFEELAPSKPDWALTGVSYIDGDNNVTYEAEATIEYMRSDTPQRVSELLNDPTKTHEEKVEQQPLLFGWTDDLKHWLEWPVVYDEEGHDTGKRINPDTQEEVQFDKVKMDAVTGHYYQTYCQYVQAVRT